MNSRCLRNTASRKGERIMAIVKPENMDFSNKNIIMINWWDARRWKVHACPCLLPTFCLLTQTKGMARVNPAHRKDSSICKTYEELLADIKSAEGKYKTIAIDTGGALIELMKDWAMRTEPSANKKKWWIFPCKATELSKASS